MTDLQVGDQVIRYDRDATAAIYEPLRGWADDCTCITCRNFALQRDSIYPPTFVALLKQLGIDPRKEGESIPYALLESGLYYYGGWFYLVGELVTAGEGITQPDGWPRRFGHFFTKVFPNTAAFRRGHALAVEFETEVPWILPDDPDTDLRPATRNSRTPDKI